MNIIDWLRGRVVDLRSSKEIDREEDLETRAQSSLSGEDEATARKLVTLITRARRECESDQKDAFERTGAEIRTIGEHLHMNGGDDRTLQVAYRAQALGARLRDFQNYWNGIGRWMF